MKNLYQLSGVVSRIPHASGDLGDDRNGSFRVRKMTRDGGVSLAVIASSGFGWEHVSVSRRNRTPTWEEMAFVARLFFEPDETLIQYRPPADEYVNDHPFCLHWWRPIGVELPRPPKWMVGGTLEEASEEMRKLMEAGVR